MKFIGVRSLVFWSTRRDSPGLVMSPSLLVLPLFPFVCLRYSNPKQTRSRSDGCNGKVEVRINEFREVKMKLRVSNCKRIPFFLLF